MSVLATLFVLLVGAWLPIAAWRSSRRLIAAEGTAPPAAPGGPSGALVSRRAFYISAFSVQLLALALALFTADEIGLTLIGPFRLEPLAWLATLAVMGGLLATLPWRWRTRTPAQRLRQALYAPVTPADAVANVALCLLAGVGEELVYRRVLHECLWWWTGSWWLAAALCALSFGAAHAMQGRRSMLIITGVALWMHLTVLWTGSLHLAMFVHAVYDLIATFSIARWVKRDEAAAALAPATTTDSQAHASRF